MTGRQFLDLLASRTRHRGPWSGSGTSIVCGELMERTRAFFPKAHTDAAQMARLAAAGHTVLGFDMVMPLFSVCHEVSAIGMQVNWGTPQSMPESGPPVFHCADDIRIPTDMGGRPAWRTPLEAIRLLKRQVGARAVVCGKVFGPWTLAYHLFGIEDFLMLSIDDPDEVRRILVRLVGITLSFAKAQIEAGADCLLLADHATRDLCSPETYERFLLPVHTQLAEQISVPLVLHICGNTVDRIAMIAKTGVACFHWDTKSGDAGVIRRLAGPEMALMGGVCNLTLLRGRACDVAGEAEAAAKAGIDIVGPECAVPLGTPLVNLQAIRSCEAFRLGV